jgi:hypothetical protein
MYKWYIHITPNHLFVSTWEDLQAQGFATTVGPFSNPHGVFLLSVTHANRSAMLLYSLSVGPRVNITVEQEFVDV